MTPGTCRECGCQDLSACWDEEAGPPCFWVERDLCSRCASQFTDKEAEALERTSLLHQALMICLNEKRSAVLVVVRNDDDPEDVTYMAKTDRAEVERLLRFLLESFPETPGVPITLEIRKGFSPPRDPDRRN